MMFYTLALDKEAQKMCTIVTSFDPFKYNKVPMGVVNLQLLLKLEWKKYEEALMIPYTLMTLEYFLIPGTIIFLNWI